MTIIFKALIILLILAAGYFLTHRLLPFLVQRLLRLLGHPLSLSPAWKKRIDGFKQLKRGYYSFLVISTLFVASLFLELLVNNKPLAIRYNDRWAFPAVEEWLDKAIFFANISYFNKASAFGQRGDAEVDYRRFAAVYSNPALLEEEFIKLEGELEAKRAAFAKMKVPGTNAHPLRKKRYESSKKSIDRLEADIAAFGEVKKTFREGNAFILMPLYPHAPGEHRLDLPGEPPHRLSLELPMGTDDSGADVLVIILYGFRTSMAFALVVSLIGYTVGTMIGGLMGYYGGWTDIMTQRFIEIWSAIPFLYVIMIIAAIITPSFLLLCVMLVILRSWIGITWTIRGEFFRERAKDYVQAAIAIGVSDWKIMLKHILPNSLVPLVSFVPFGIVGYIGVLVSLDYLGFGLPSDTPSWGALLKQGTIHLRVYPHLIIIPSCALALTLFTVVNIGEAVREAFDPKVYSRLR